MCVKHATASVFLFTAMPRGWRLGLIEHPRLGRLMIPGGHVEDDESPAQAGLREVSEETGLTSVSLLDVTAPPLPVGFPHQRVPSPWWITQQHVPADNHLGEPHVHLDHQYVAVAGVAEAASPGAHPFAWYSDSHIAELDMWEDTKLLAKMLFPVIDDLVAGRSDSISALEAFTAH